MYYIYEVFGVKIGCTTDPVRRVEKQQGFSSEEYTILESHIDLDRASERERELQVEKGYPVDIADYKNILHQQSIVAHSRKGKPGRLTIPWTYTKEAIQNRINNSPLKEMGKKTSERQKGKPQPQFHTKEVIVKRNKNIKKALNKPVGAYNKDGSLFKIFNSPTEAAKELGVGRSLIYDTLGGFQKTCRGYVWKYL